MGFVGCGFWLAAVAWFCLDWFLFVLGFDLGLADAVLGFGLVCYFGFGWLLVVPGLLFGFGCIGLVLFCCFVVFRCLFDSRLALAGVGWLGGAWIFGLVAWVYFGDFGFGRYVGVISDFGGCVWFGLFGFGAGVCCFGGLLWCSVVQVYGGFGLVVLFPVDIGWF